MNENDVYFGLNGKKLIIGVFKQSDNSLSFFNEENININSISENTDFQKLEKQLEKNIKQVEKKINSFVNNISLIVDTASTLPIYISLTKKLDNKKIQQKDVKHLIQDAKQQIARAYPEKQIVHIIIKKYIVNDIDYTFVPVDIDCNKISIEIKFICFPKNLIKKIPFYKKLIEEFINDVSIADFPMRLLWREELLKSPVEIFIEKIQRRFGIKKKVSKTRLIKSKEELVIAAQKMHDKMFRSNEDDRPVLLDQGGSGWNPIESTKYFLDCKVVLVTRDPRDQFAEIKYYKKGTSVNGFVDWYKEMQRRIKQIDNPIVLRLRFEDFVNKNKEIFIKSEARNCQISVRLDKRFPVIPVRAIENKASEKFLQEQKRVIKLLDNSNISLKEAQLQIEHFWAGSLRKAVIDGDIDNGSLMAGQSVSLVKKIQPVNEIICEIVKQAEKQITNEQRIS